MSNSSSTLPRLLTEAEAAEFLRVSPKTLQSWRYRGVEPRYRKLQSVVRYELGDLIAFIEGDVGEDQ